MSGTPFTTTRQQLTICGQRFVVELPADPEAMLQRAVDGEASGAGDTDPYWGLLWDASPTTAATILRQPWDRSLRTIELGCGVGLAGIAALRAGHFVTLTDLVPDALELTRRNAAANGFPSADVRQLDWHQPPGGDYELAIASDVLYDSSNHFPILSTLDAVLTADGIAWIGDAGRHNAGRFVHLAEAAGWHVQIRDAEGVRLPGVSHLQFQLLILSRRTSGRES